MYLQHSPVKATHLECGREDPGGGGEEESALFTLHMWTEKRSGCSLIVKLEYCSQNNNTLMGKNNKILLQWSN